MAPKNTGYIDSKTGNFVWGEKPKESPIVINKEKVPETPIIGGTRTTPKFGGINAGGYGAEITPKKKTIPAPTVDTSTIVRGGSGTGRTRIIGASGYTPRFKSLGITGGDFVGERVDLGTPKGGSDLPGGPGYKEPILMDVGEASVGKQFGPQMLDVTDLAKIDTGATEKSADMNKMLEQVKGIVGSQPNGVANRGFVDSLAKAKYGRPATLEELEAYDQKSFSEAIAGFDLGSQIGETATEEGLAFKPGVAQDQKDWASNLAATKSRSEWTKSDVANYNFITDSSETFDDPADVDLAAPDAGTGEDVVITEDKTTVIEENPDVAGQATDFNWEEINNNITNVQTELDTATKHYDDMEAEIRGRTISKSAMERELGEMARERNKEMAYLNVRKATATGSFDRARQIMQAEGVELQKNFENGINLSTAGFIPTDSIEGLDITQYDTAPDGTYWIKDTTGTSQDWVSVDNYAKNILEGKTTLSAIPKEQRQSVSNRMRALTDAKWGGMSEKDMKSVNTMSSALKQEPSYRDMLAVLNGYKTVETGWSMKGQVGGFGDLAMVNGFQRMIDPGAVVREGEFKTVAEAQGWLQKILNIQGKVTDGSILTPESADRMKAIADGLYNNKADLFNDSIGTIYKARANAFGIDYNLVGQDFVTTTGSASNADRYFEGVGTSVQGINYEQFATDALNALADFPVL